MREVTYQRLSCSACCAWSPTLTSMPAARSRSKPLPRTRGSGSSIAATTRVTPAAMSASVQGGVRPWWLHGSRLTYSVAPRAPGPACARAAASACGWPAPRCHPSPTTCPFWTSTAPTSGLGAVCPAARAASRRTRPITRDHPPLAATPRGWTVPTARAGMHAPCARHPSHIRTIPSAPDSHRCPAFGPLALARGARPRGCIEGIAWHHRRSGFRW